MLDEWFNIVDDKGIVLGKEKRENCHNGSKMLHSVIHVHIFDLQNRLLLQKRSLNKDIQPGKWDTSVGGHIKAGENVLDAVKRESFEEAGIIIDTDRLYKIKEYIFESKIEKEYVYSYIYRYGGDIDFQKEEIDEVGFFTFETVKNMIDNKITTINFIKEFDFLQKIDLTVLK